MANEQDQLIQRAENAARLASDSAVRAEKANEALHGQVSELLGAVRDLSEAVKDSLNTATADKTEALYKQRRLFLETTGMLRERFGYWSNWLQTAGLQLNVAVVTANWLIHDNLQVLWQNIWAILSLGTVGLGLVFDLLGSLMLASCLRKRMVRVEAKIGKNKWESDAYSSLNKDLGYDPFPYTRTIEFVGRLLRILKFALPVLGLAFLVVGAFARVEYKPSTPWVSNPQPVFRQVGSLVGFVDGDTLISARSESSFKLQEWVRVVRADSLGLASFVIVGHVDKRGLKEAPRRTYGSNEALALARAGVVRRIMLAAVDPSKREELERRIVLLNSTAWHIGSAVDSASMAKDRSVVVYALTGLPDEQAVNEERSGKRAP